MAFKMKGSCFQSPLKKSAAWERKEGKNPEGGLNQKGVDSYRKENPGYKLQTAVTTKPSSVNIFAKYPGPAPISRIFEPFGI